MMIARMLNCDGGGDYGCLLYSPKLMNSQKIQRGEGGGGGVTSDSKILFIWKKGGGF